MPSTGCDWRGSESAINTRRAQGINENQHHICVERWIRQAAASRLLLTPISSFVCLSPFLTTYIHSSNSVQRHCLPFLLLHPFLLSCVSTRAEGAGRFFSSRRPRGERKQKTGGEVEGDGQGDDGMDEVRKEKKGKKRVGKDRSRMR